MKNFLHHTIKYQKYVLVCVLGVSCILSGYFLGSYVQKEKYATFLKSFKNIRENSNKYSFINPLIGGVSAPATDVGIFSDIKSDVVSYLHKEELKGDLYDYSFYFRDLNTGLWFGDNESINFFPASLFKLPIAIAVYKQVEDDPSFFKKQFVYTEDLSTINTRKQLNSESGLIVGQSYSVEVLVEKMLTLSDNGAKNLLLSSFDKKYLNQLFNIMEFSDPDLSTVYGVSSRKYSHFLRILYGSSYINEEHSELILEMLSKSTFKEGLVAGLPATAPVAHKFGAYEIPETIKGKEIMTVQLHDCGVVYHASKPYVLCIMTKGKDDKSLFRIISSVSRMVYNHQEVHSLNGE